MENPRKSTTSLCSVRIKKKVTKKKIQIDPQLKEDRELRETVINETGSTAIQRQFDAISLKAKKKQEHL